LYLIIGLGNPGEEYAVTRHNLGFMVLEGVAGKLGISALKKNRKCNALVADVDYQGRHLILAEPQTYMNNSGQAVRDLLHWYKIKPANLILIYDDMDLEVGSIRVRAKGNTGGHHGVESIIQHVKTNEFARVRMGIGKPPVGIDGAKYVLSKIPLVERELVDQAILSATDAVLDIPIHGIEYVMNAFNA